MFRIVVIGPDEAATLRLRGAVTRVDGLVVVGTAHDAAEALDLLSSTDANVALLDASVPPDDDSALIAAIKHTFPSVRVVTLTEDPHEPAAERALKAGADGVLRADGSG